MTAPLAAAVVAVTVAAGGCTPPRPAYCEDLEAWNSLSSLDAAIRAGDSSEIESQLEELDSLANSAPDEIRDDMLEISDTMAAVVELNSSSSDTSEDELKREQVNARLGRVIEHTTAVGSWAEEECGIRLD